MYYFIRLDLITLLGCVSKEKDWFHPCGYWNRISISTLFCFRTGEFRFLDQFNVISVFGIWVLNIVSCIPQAHVYKWWKPSGKMYDGLCRNLQFAPVVFWGMFGWVSIYFTRLFYSISLFWKMEISLVNVALLFLFLTRCISLLENQLKWKRIPILPKKRFDFQSCFYIVRSLSWVYWFWFWTIFQVLELHSIFISSLKELYERHKVDFGYDAIPLYIHWPIRTTNY